MYGICALETICRTQFASQRNVGLLYISETEDKLLIKAELPGLEAKDVEVCVLEDVLTIKDTEKNKEKD